MYITVCPSCGCVCCGNVIYYVPSALPSAIGSGPHFARMARSDRQKLLREQYFFDCCCPTCLKGCVCSSLRWCVLSCPHVLHWLAVLTPCPVQLLSPAIGMYKLAMLVRHKWYPPRPLGGRCHLYHTLKHGIANAWILELSDNPRTILHSYHGNGKYKPVMLGLASTQHHSHPLVCAVLYFLFCAAQMLR